MFLLYVPLCVFTFILNWFKVHLIKRFSYCCISCTVGPVNFCLSSFDQTLALPHCVCFDTLLCPFLYPGYTISVLNRWETFNEGFYYGYIQVDNPQLKAVFLVGIVFVVTRLYANVFVYVNACVCVCTLYTCVLWSQTKERGSDSTIQTVNFSLSFFYLYAHENCG